MTIKEVETQLGITRANVRFYEKEGLLFPKRNPLNDYREYSNEDVELLKKILFLRNLEIPLEQIRLLAEGKEELETILLGQQEKLIEQQKRTEEACLICAQMIQEKTKFSELPAVGEGYQKGEARLKDTLHEMWFFWDKLVVWGLFAIQIIYTLGLLPILPGQIPTEWQGMRAVEFHRREYFLFYLAISALWIFAGRQLMYQFVVGGLRLYLDEMNAVLTIGALGSGFALQVYTVLFLNGISFTLTTFLAACLVVYGIVILFIVLLYWKLIHRRHLSGMIKRGGEKEK